MRFFVFFNTLKKLFALKVFNIKNIFLIKKTHIRQDHFVFDHQKYNLDTLR